MITIMMSGQILLMRHAEKPDDASNVHLSPAGLQRAASYIPQTFGKPDFLFAAADSEQSHRPVETIEPLSQATGVPIDSTIANGHHDFLANELMTKLRYEGQRIVICWHHESMRHFSRELGGRRATARTRGPRTSSISFSSSTTRTGRRRCSGSTSRFDLAAIDERRVLGRVPARFWPAGVAANLAISPVEMP
jgi:hypothetical protein